MGCRRLLDMEASRSLSSSATGGESVRLMRAGPQFVGAMVRQHQQQVAGGGHLLATRLVLGIAESKGRKQADLSDWAPLLQHSNLYLLAITRTNVNAAAILVFLHKLIEIFKHYFQEVCTTTSWCLTQRASARASAAC